VRSGETARVPNDLVPKVLTDILGAWANFAINEQHVLSYRVAVLSPAVIDAAPLEATDPIVAVVVLRSKIMRVLDNIREVNNLPAAELARTRDGLSLAEIRLRLEEVLRFQLEPVVPRVRGLLSNPAVTTRFLETQVSYDQRQLAAQEEVAASIRESLLVYTRPNNMAAPTAGAAGSARPLEGDTVISNMSDSFLDRIPSLT